MAAKSGVDVVNNQLTLHDPTSYQSIIDIDNFVDAVPFLHNNDAFNLKSCTFQA